MADEKRLLTPEDINNLKTIDDVQVSPDGRWIAYVVATPEPMDHGYTRHVYVISTGGGDPIQLTRGGKDSSPRWSPDGKRLAFVSTRNGAPQIYILPVNGLGGEARQLTSNERGAVAPDWSPDGTQIAYLSRMNSAEMVKEDSDEEVSPPVDKLEGKHRKERSDEDEKNRFDPRIVERIPFRQGTSFMDDRAAQVYVIGVDDEKPEARRLTRSLTDNSAPHWSGDGKTIFVSRSTRPEADESFQYDNVYAIDATTGDETRFEDEKSWVIAPLPSPDNQWVAAIRRESSRTYGFAELIVYPRAGGEPIVLNEKLDRTVATSMTWSPDSTLYVNIANQGDVEVYKADIEAREMSAVITGTMDAGALSVAVDGGIAFAGATPENPNELYYQAAGDRTPVQLTHINKWIDDVRVLPKQEIRYKGGDGETDIQGWYILPPDYEEGKSYPLALNIHGGPHVHWSASFESMWIEWQTHAAAGYIAFYCNPRGSVGYGQAFMEAIVEDWGDLPMGDIMAGVDTLIDKGLVDASRMAVTGGSYGGYMTAWILGHSDRFATAVSQRGVYNLISFYGTSDVPVLITSEFNAEPWEDPDKLWKHSPLAYAHNIKTPLLIIHSENDYRVPIEQGEQLFAIVRRSGGKVKMIRYPNEGHELSRIGDPHHRIHRLKSMIDWFDATIFPDRAEKGD